MWVISDYSDKAVKEICYNCNSQTAKQSYNYFRRLLFSSKDKVWSKVWNENDKPVAFYFASRCKTHIRLIEIAVHKDYQKRGYGKKVLFDLLAEMKKHNINKLTFRTPIAEDAPNFWLHIGAQIVGLKGEDYEMEINII